MITKLIILGKNYFDFEYIVHFKVETEGHFGFMFRYVDPYNYYVISIQKGII